MISFSAIGEVTNTFFFKDHTHLTAAQLLSLGIWIALPWSTKIIFGTIIDGITFFGSNRLSYLILGSVLSIAGSLVMVDVASTQYSVHLLGEYGALLLSGLINTVGIVMSNIVANTMAIEIAILDEEKANVQVLTRIMSGLGGLLAAAGTGILAQHLTPTQVFALVAFVPFISILASVFIEKEEESPKVLNKPLLIGGLAFGVYCVACGLFAGTKAQLLVFLMSSLVVCVMLWSVIKDQESSLRKTFILTCVAIFLFRCTPGTGAGESWWMISELKFDPEFLGLLKTTGHVLSFIVLWASSYFITKIDTKKLLTLLTVLSVVLFIPQILVYYHIHELLGWSARHVMLIDNAIIMPLGSLSMVPLGILIANNAPKEKRAIYISLISSFMNISLMAGDLITKQLNEVYLVTRTDFSQLGKLMISSLIISTVLSVSGILVLRKK